MKVMGRILVIVTVLVVALTLGGGVASAHPHQSSRAHQGEGQQIANGQNHGPFTTTSEGHGRTCGGDPAAYGLESAHHGPDAGDPGKADGCYETDSMPPASDDNNPAID
jgi:hypothetical protein